MAILDCKMCGGPVHSKGNKCLRCGADQQSPTRDKYSNSEANLRAELENLQQRYSSSEKRRRQAQADLRRKTDQVHSLTKTYKNRKSEYSPIHKKNSSSLNHYIHSHKYIGIAGSIITLIGCFMPIANLPIVGGVSYIFPPGRGIGDGVFVAVLALVGLVGAIRRGRILLFIASSLGAILLLSTIIGLTDILNDTISEGGLAGVLFSTISLGPAVIVISIGLVTMFVSAIMTGEK